MMDETQEKKIEQGLDEVMGPPEQPPAAPEAQPRFWQRYAWAGVVAVLAGVYAIINLLLREIVTGFVSVFVVQPLLWCAVIGVMWAAARYGTGGRLVWTRKLVWIGLLLGAFQVAVGIIAAVFSQFGNSPYAHTARLVFLNLVFWGTTLVGVEVARAYLISFFPKRFTMTALIVIGLLFTAFDLPLIRYSGVSTGMEAVPFFGGVWLPLFASGVLATYLALQGGPLASISYLVVMKAFEWWSPILPDLSWMVAAFIGVLVPILAFMVVQGMFVAPATPKPEAAEEGAAPAEEAKPAKKPRSAFSRAMGWVSWAVVFALSAVIIIFATGGFGVRPGVVLTGSMSPAIAAGDIVLVRDVPFADIAEGDVIQFEDHNVSIWHRVIEIKDDGGTMSFVTKGDANNTKDVNPVRVDNYSGKVVGSIPKLGLLSLKLKEFIGRQ